MNMIQNRPLHIAIIVPNTHINNKMRISQIGGAERQVIYLLHSYKKKPNVRISLITKYTEIKPVPSKIEVFQTGASSLKFIFNSMLLLVKINRKNPIDIINPHMLGISVVPAIVAKYIIKKPICVKISGDISQYIKAISKNPNPLINKMLYLFYMKYTTFVINQVNYLQALNENNKNDLIIHYKIKENRILLIPNGIPLDNMPFSQTFLPKNRFGFVGRLESFKCIPLLLEVFIKYLNHNKNASLLLFGKGSQEKEIADFIKTHHLEEHIKLMGFETDQSKLYAQFDYYILTSLGEGISNSILEAMAYGKPVIASKVSGNIDVLKHNKTGILFENEKPDEFLEGLKKLVSNSMFTNELRQNARNEIEKIYNIDVITNRLIANFMKIQKSYL